MLRTSLSGLRPGTVRGACVPGLPLGLALVLALVLALGSAARAYEVSAPGLDAILRGDVKGGTAALERAAGAGDARAAFLLFGMYFRGYGVVRNLDAARRWLAHSEARPISESLFVYGLAHYTGTALPRDMNKAFERFRQAAEKGHSSAQFYVGRMLVEGTGTAKDPVRGLAALTKAAKEGSALALEYLAGYHRTKGPADARKHLDYLARAAKAGVRSAQAELHEMYYAGRGVRRNSALALFWGEVAAGQGTKGLDLRIARMHEAGRGTRKDLVQAMHWYRRAAEAGDGPAALRLARIYRGGIKVKDKEVVKPSAALAYMWFDLAARRGVAGAAKARDALGRTMKPFALKLAKAFAARWKPKRVRKDFRLRGGGTGVFVNFSHWVVTNEHVIKRCSLLAVQHDGRIWDRVKVIAARRDIDLALLEVEVPDGRSFTHGIAAIAPPDRAPLGEQVAVFGYPWSGILSSQGVFTVGILNAHVGARNNRNYIQISAPIQPGNSGSAVYDETGQVMGIVASSLRPIKNTMPQIVNFAVKGSVMREMIDAFHTPNYSFDAKTAPTLTVKQRAKVAQRNAAHVLCYGH